MKRTQNIENFFRRKLFQRKKAGDNSDVGDENEQPSTEISINQDITASQINHTPLLPQLGYSEEF